MKEVILAICILFGVLGIVLWQADHANSLPLTGMAGETTAKSTSSSSANPTVHTTPVIPSAGTASSTYIHILDVPQVEVQNTPYLCTPINSTDGRPRTTTEKQINGRTFCVTETTEGAAGSIYHEYQYRTTTTASTSISYTFTVQYAQCQNFPESQATACKKEQTAFDPDTLVADYFINRNYRH